MVRSEVTASRAGERTVYGLRFFEDGNLICEEPSLFCDRAAAEALCAAVNVADLAPEHIWNVLEDAVNA